MRSSHTSRSLRSPRIITCALLATGLCIFLPYKIARDTEVLELTEQPVYLSCSGAPVRSRGSSWLPGNAGAIRDLRADQKLVQQYIDRCIKGAEIDNKETKETLGIAIPAGGVPLLSNTLAVVNVLRNTLRSVLPVEVIYNGPEEYDEELVTQLEALQNVTCLDARQVAHPRHHPAVKLKGIGFEFKAFVLAYVTSFDKVLLLDADNLPLKNPDTLFASGSEEHGNLFRHHGAIFWPDFGQKQQGQTTVLAKHLDIKPEAYTTFNLSVPWQDSARPFRFTESGQILIDRVRHADVLEWLWFLSSHPRPVKNWMWGDKDTYRLAFALADKADDYLLVPTGPRVALDAGGIPPDPPFRHTGMVQHDLEGNLQFLHRTYLGKFDPAEEEPWREMNFVSNPITPQQAVVYREDYGFYPHQVSIDFEKHCCHSADSGSGECDLKLCTEPGKPLPVLAVSVDNLDHGVKAILKQQDALFTAIKANYTARSG